MNRADFSAPDLIVHNILDSRRSLDDIREDLKGIMERLVRLSSSFHSLGAEA